jgi:hypothetical protein
MLQDYAAKQLTTKLTRSQAAPSVGWGGITEFKELETPWEATVNGTEVTVMGLADQIGSSPVELCCEANGEQAFIPIANVRITDRRLLPRAAGIPPTGLTTTHRGRGRTARTTNTTTNP